ncbi:MAG: hypothetical protein F4117_07875 [Acidimicrobiales bacterium]|nr:hypothetical protein [Acidimicrobiales bacterium]MYB81374.1 hypothetical protein [Acidimicrobiales bacterium]MYI12467.1 hypothetical protein [Acidimicrobiales bacterium]
MRVEDARGRAARHAAEQALIRVVEHYGECPEFVVLGGLVPELLCAHSDALHAGTTDIDVQANLEIACGSVNALRLEQSLRQAAFVPDGERIWRWAWTDGQGRAGVKFELLADLDDVPAGSEVAFDNCEQLGAANLRGTRFASEDFEVHQLQSRTGGAGHRVEVRFCGLAGFLLAKCVAAHRRGLPKDWYDIAFVLLHNDAGGPADAARAVHRRFSADLPAVTSAIEDLAANFADEHAQGALAYADQMAIDHPETDRATALADAVTAVSEFRDQLQPHGSAGSMAS